MAYPAPPKTQRWIGQSARRPPPPAPEPCVVVHQSVLLSGSLLTRCTLHGWCSAGGLCFYESTQDMCIYIKILTPSYGRNTTATTMPNQPNIPSLLTPFRSHLCQSDAMEPIGWAATPILSLYNPPHSFFAAAHHQLHHHRFINLKCQNANLMYMPCR
jgi:hypothetical protein